MTKLSRRYLSSDEFGHYVNNLWSGFTLMDNKEDIRLLFRDLFTHTEYKMLAKRLEIARRLLNGQGYEEIIKQLNVTGRTIANVSNILAEKGDGFRKVHSKLSAIERKHQNTKNKRIDRLSQPFSLGNKEQRLAKNILIEGSKYISEKFSSHQRKKSVNLSLNI